MLELKPEKPRDFGFFSRAELLARESLGINRNISQTREGKHTMRHFKNLFVLMLLMGSLTGLQACDDNDGPLEDAGEAVDEAADDVGDAIEDKWPRFNPRPLIRSPLSALAYLPL
jgi:hypothetical protein